MSNTVTWPLLAALLLATLAKPVQADTEDVVAGVLLGTLLVAAARDARDDDAHYRYPAPTHRIKYRGHEHHAYCDHGRDWHPSARGRAKGKAFAPGHRRWH